MRRPASVFGLSFLAAQAFAVCLPPAAVLLPAAFLVLLWAFCPSGRRSAPLLLATGAVLASFVAHDCFVLLNVRPALGWVGQAGQVTAVVESAESSYQEGMRRCVVTVLEVDGQKTDFKAYVEALPDSLPGEVVVGRFSFESLEGSARKFSHYADGVYVEAVYEGDISWQGESRALRFRLARLREALSFQARRYLPEPYGAILSAITVGDKSRMSQTVRDTFRQAGISHLAVVSGLHLTLVCGLFWRPASAYTKRRRLRAVGAAALTLLIMGVTGFTPSVCRAGITMLLLCAGDLLLAPTDGLTCLGLAGLALCLQNGYAVCDIGFELSFCATGGVLAAGELTRRWAQREEEEVLRYDIVRLWAGRLLLPPLFAALGTLPIQPLQGLSVSGVSALTNLLAVWLIQPILFLGLCSALCGLFVPFQLAGLLLNLLAGMFVRVLWRLACFTAGLPFARLSLPPRYTLWLLFLLGAAWLWAKNRQKWRLFGVLACVILAGGGLCAHVFDKGVVRVALVGNATTPCAVILQEGNACVLFRGGRYNQKKVEDYLYEKGVDEAACWILLSQEGGALPDGAGQVIELEALPQNQVESHQMGDCTLSLLNQSEGNLALLEVRGYSLAMAAGHPALAQPPRVGVYLGGPARPDFARFDAVLVTSNTYGWLAEIPAEEVVYSRGTPTVEIRPGRSACIRKGESLFG